MARHPVVARRSLALVTSFSLLCVLALVPSRALALTPDQEACSNAMNKAGAKVAATQGKENTSCIKAKGAGKLVGTTDACMVADTKQKVAKAEAKATDADVDKCPFGPFAGFAGAAPTIAAATAEEIALAEAIFGSPVEAAMQTGACQSTVSKTYEKFGATWVKEFNGCKKLEYKNAGNTVEADLIACMDTDAKGKVQKARLKIQDAITKKCGPVAGLGPSFPGCSGSLGDSLALATCISSLTECHMCLFVNEMDGLTAPCDFIDDGAVNQSCRQCLNGSVESPEQCDDGAESMNCDVDCTLASCGDGQINATRGETCDDSGESANCDDDCTAPACTDGNLNVTAGEDCDDGNVTDGDGCDNNCTPTGCGNGVVTAGETCDDGNLVNGDGCDANCTPTACGNGVVTAGEICDDGNLVDDDGCDSNCTPTGCGNGVVTSGETCDDGDLMSGDGCDANCTPTACGNGVVTAGETCDDGNLVDDDGCDSNCTPTGCGNGILTSGETCDDGDLVSGDGCDANCTPTGCGNGVVTSGETCDDGNLTDGDGCDSNCTPTGCGNGIVTAPEVCDTSGESAGCDDDCTLPACHDGNHNAAAGEQCDDGNLSDNDACVGMCVLATCGDGLLCSAGGCTTGPTGGTEECDNAGANSDVTPDACRTNCADAGCGDNVTDTGEFCDTGGNSMTCDADCTAPACGDGFTNPANNEDCDDGGESATCDVDCTDQECGDGYVNVVAGEQCDDGNTTPGDGCNATCQCGMGSGEAGCQDATCPTKGELTLLAQTGSTPCANNGDCLAGECDTGLGRCVSETELDTGWTGISHDADINDLVKVSGDLICPGPGPTCGECEVVGLEPDYDLCRCANDNRAICDEPFVADADDCGGAVCNCYFGAPLPLSAGNTPACVVNRFAQDISGTANVDSGDGEITANLKSSVFLGLTKHGPCPVCGGTCTAPPASVGDTCGQDIDCDSTGGAGDGVCGNYDPVPGDGIRGGKCFGGDNADETCDGGAINTSFPAPQGQYHSLDCFPDSGLNVSGAGLTINLVQTTGSVSLPANVTCGFPPSIVFNCPCGQCSLDISRGCTSNADCSGGGGNCVTDGGGKPLPNQCDDQVCTDNGGGEGVCLANSPDKSCDGIVRANGDGFLSCNSDLDCAPINSGIAGGNCSLTKQRECFLDPITATGVMDANKPLGVAAFCIPKTANGAINSVAGLPGPGRVKNQAVSRLFCANNPNNLYTPGIGCP